ncbi:hypothetical protein JCM24511_02872 [Saitozyma sp. JCM 24511]|nr:hypothetical protein JCM24511_02872 [Saitozyma sp. JCM 24511]
MAIMSKKDARKAGKSAAAAAPAPKEGKGKGKLVTAVPAPKTKLPVAEVEDDESEWSSEDEDPENGGVSEKGMMRLMELVGEEDLDEMELAQLAGATDEDEDEEDEEDEDAEGLEEEEDEEDEDEEVEGAEALEDESDDEDEDAEDDEEAPVDNSILISAPEEDVLELDEVGSEVSVDEDAVPERKVMINNRPAMRILTDQIKMTNAPWPEHLVMSSKEIIDVDPSDDLQREMAFYKVALEQVAPARKLAAKYDIPFSRPTDYYAEMVKSDEHMERVRSKLVEEAQGIKKSEAAKKQRDLKKYGKQIQVEKLKQREMDKKGFQDKVQGLKRKRKEGMELGEDDDFGIEIDNDEGPSRGAGRGGRGGPSGRGKSKMPRQARDAKYSLGGGGRRSKQNTRESANDIPGWGGGGGGGGRGGRGGKAGGGRGAKSQRPGKSRRAAGRG